MIFEKKLTPIKVRVKFLEAAKTSMGIFLPSSHTDHILDG